MRNYKGFLMFFLVFVFILSLIAFLKSAEIATPQAKLIISDGNVTVCKKGNSKWENAVIYEILSPGDEIKTSANSMAVLLLWDKSTIRISENSHIKIEILSQNGEDVNIKFKLYIGKVWADVVKFCTESSSFEVESPYTVASVKGTEFEVDTNGEDTTIDVWDGNVNVKNNKKEFLLKQNMKIKAAIKGFVSNPENFTELNATNWQNFNMDISKDLNEWRNEDCFKANQYAPEVLANKIKDHPLYGGIFSEIAKLPKGLRQKINANLKNGKPIDYKLEKGEMKLFWGNIFKENKNIPPKIRQKILKNIKNGKTSALEGIDPKEKKSLEKVILKNFINENKNK